MQETMEPCDADIVESSDTVTHEFGGDGRFLGDGGIGRPRAEDLYGSFRLRRARPLLQGKYTRNGMISHLFDTFSNRRRLLRGNAGDEDIATEGPHGPNDLDDLLGGLGFAVNHLGKAPSQASMMVHTGEVEDLLR